MASKRSNQTPRKDREDNGSGGRQLAAERVLGLQLGLQVEVKGA